MKNLSMTSHMQKHVVDRHDGEKLEEVDFRMKILQFIDVHSRGRLVRLWQSSPSG